MGSYKSIRSDMLCSVLMLFEELFKNPWTPWGSFLKRTFRYFSLLSLLSLLSLHVLSPEHHSLWGVRSAGGSTWKCGNDKWKKYNREVKKWHLKRERAMRSE
jgi:hypothetical protein